MTIGFGHQLAAITLAPHMGALPLALSSQAHRAPPAHVFWPVMVVVAAYLLVLVVLVVFGVFMGWQPDNKGNGGGGGGKRRRPSLAPTPPGGCELTGDQPEPAFTGDFAAWEGELQAAREQAAPEQPDEPGRLLPAGWQPPD